MRCSRVCGHSFECQERTDEVDCGFEAAISLVVAGGDTSELLEIAEEVFDEMAPSVHGEVAGDFGGAICFWWDDGRRAPFVQFRADPIDVESLVSKEGIELDTRDQGRNANAVMALPRQQDEPGQIAQRIDHCDNFSCQTAA